VLIVRIQKGALLDTGKLRNFVTVAREKARLPVRSALFKQDTGGLVVRWVTTSESPLLYVFASLYCFYLWAFDRMEEASFKMFSIDGFCSFFW
jgi:hypothetical protein